MEKNTLDFVTEKTNDLIHAPMCYSGLRTAAQNWLKAVGGPNEADAMKKYMAELEADVETVDQALQFALSPKAVEVCGEDGAKKLTAHLKAIKAAGAKYCDCPACSAGAAILEKKSELL